MGNQFSADIDVCVGFAKIFSIHNFERAFFLAQGISFLALLGPTLLFAKVQYLFEFERTVIFLFSKVRLVERRVCNPRMFENLFS